MAFSNLKKVTISPPFGSASYIVPRDSLIFPYVEVDNFSPTIGGNQMIYKRKLSTDLSQVAIWGNSRIITVPQYGILFGTGYAFCAAGDEIRFSVDASNIELYILELDTDVQDN